MDYFHLDLNDIETEGEFVWGLGSYSRPATFTAFESSEPNGGLIENCVALHTHFEMIDIQCEGYPLHTSPIQLCYN